MSGGTWRAPAWLCPDLRGIADPGQRPSPDRKVELHREQYVSRRDMERYVQHMHPMPVSKGWTTALREENHPKNIPLDRIKVRIGPPVAQRRSGPPPLEWPDDLVGVLLTPSGIRLDRGGLEHPKKRLRERPTEILHDTGALRGIAGEGADLVVVVPAAPKGPGLGLHRCARTAYRDAGATSPHLLLNVDRDDPQVEPGASELHSVLRSGRVKRIVRLTRHHTGGSLRTEHHDDIEWRDDTGELRAVRAMALSVRDDLLEGDDFDALAAEVSLALLDRSGLLLERITL